MSLMSMAGEHQECMTAELRGAEQTPSSHHRQERVGPPHPSHTLILTLTLRRLKTHTLTRFPTHKTSSSPLPVWMAEEASTLQAPTPPPPCPSAWRQKKAGTPQMRAKAGVKSLRAPQAQSHHPHIQQACQVYQKACRMACQAGAEAWGVSVVVSANSLMPTHAAALMVRQNPRKQMLTAYRHGRTGHHCCRRHPQGQMPCLLEREVLRQPLCRVKVQRPLKEASRKLL